MRVGADDKRGAAVAKKSHRLFLAGRLAVKVDDDGGERIIQRIHENAPHRVDDQCARAIFGLDHRRAAARRARGIVDRADELRRALDEDKRLFLIPGVIAERDRIDAGVDELPVYRLGNAEAAGGILAIGDDEIEFPIANEIRQALVDKGTAAASDNVADKKDAHAYAFRKSIASCSVSTRSSGASKEVLGTWAISCAANASPTAVIGFLPRNCAMVRS